MDHQYGRQSRRRRRDPRKEATRSAIIEAAESLFAEFGIDGVSLRQIGSAIGSSNTSVVAYHFGSKEALVEAIFHYRLPAIDARRSELLAEADKVSRNCETDSGNALYSLVRALWLPLYEQRNERGLHSYAGFMSALTRSNLGDSRSALNDTYTHTAQLADRLKAALPGACQRRFDERINLTAVMATGALTLIDRASPQSAAESGHSVWAEHFFDDTLRMICAALLAPTGD